MTARSATCSPCRTSWHAPSPGNWRPGSCHSPSRSSDSLPPACRRTCCFCGVSTIWRRARRRGFARRSSASSSPSSLIRGTRWPTLASRMPTCYSGSMSTGASRRPSRCPAARPPRSRRSSSTPRVPGRPGGGAGECAAVARRGVDRGAGGAGGEGAYRPEGARGAGAAPVRERLLCRGHPRGARGRRSRVPLPAAGLRRTGRLLRVSEGRADVRPAARRSALRSAAEARRSRVTAPPFDRLRAALADRYALERELGRGGMATVYLARDLKHGRAVAIKVLRPEIAAALGPERFLREIEVAARLTHPHILPLHDSGEAAGFLYYVMPYIESESLRDRLEREGQLPLEEALRITREVASALAYAHNHDVVHRDIKPENILLSGGEAVVADFGIARAITQAGGRGLTETGIPVGTPAYMSPEQASGGGPIDGRSDVYSLACVLYEMLAGEPPYTGPSAQVVIAKRFTDPVPSVRRLRETIPPAVDAAIMRALAKAPADRFGTPVEFANALDRPAGARRNRAGSYALIAVGISLVAALAHGLRTKLLPRGDSGPAASHKMLVVLPLENLGAPEDEYFADGLSEAITTRLGTVPSLGVIARQSAMGYKKTTKSPQAIGKELGVEYIVAGTVRWEKSARRPNRVRVSTALMRAVDANQVWAKQYDTVLAGVFDVESNLAERVAGALDVAFAAPQREALSTPTRDVEAHDL